MQKSITGTVRDHSPPKTRQPLAPGRGFREGSHHPNDRKAQRASAVCLITGFKLNARFPFGSLALMVCQAEGLCCHTAARTHEEGTVQVAPGLQTLPMCLSFVGCDQCPFAVINHSHENNHML